MFNRSRLIEHLPLLDKYEGHYRKKELYLATYNIGIQMKRKQLTKTFMMVFKLIKHL